MNTTGIKNKQMETEKVYWAKPWETFNSNTDTLSTDIWNAINPVFTNPTTLEEGQNIFVPWFFIVLFIGGYLKSKWIKLK